MSLVGEERKAQILQWLDARGKVVSGELAKAFGVSNETIRRYLDELESEHKLKKVYGGAVKAASDREEVPHLARESIHAEAKRNIGRKAAALVREHEVIFIDEGSTTLQMVPHLAEVRGVTVLTNSFPAARTLMEQANRDRFDGKIVFLGGEVSAPHLRVTGSIAEAMLEQFYVAKAFISVDGIAPDGGFTSIDAAKSLLSRKVIRQAQEAIVTADASKLGQRYFCRIAGLSDIRSVVCDKDAPPEWASALEEASLCWIVAEGADR